MRNRILQLLLLVATYLIAPHEVLSQATSLSELAKNDMKYWKIRGRLIGDDNNKDVYNGFMTVGSGVGMSIPSEIRHPINRRDFWMYNDALYCKNQNPLFEACGFASPMFFIGYANAKC
jgi:hypothetical protein